MNQGMLLESMNLAAVWNLPVLFICKDNTWSITTRSKSVTAGDLLVRAQGLGLEAVKVDGLDVEQIWSAALRAVKKARNEKGPTFLLCSCVHLEGHMLDDHLVRTVRHPGSELAEIAGPLIASSGRRPGGSLSERVSAIGTLNRIMARAAFDDRLSQQDPLVKTRQKLSVEPERLRQLEDLVVREIDELREKALIWIEEEPHV